MVSSAFAEEAVMPVLASGVDGAATSLSEWSKMEEEVKLSSIVPPTWLLAGGILLCMNYD